MKVGAVVAAFLTLGGLAAVTGPGAAAPTVVDGYALSLVRLPSFNPASAYVYNYHGAQYPVVGFEGPCSAGILYVTNASRLACYAPSNESAWNLSAPLTLLYQTTSGIAGQVDNLFQLDTFYDVALLYGNATTTPGPTVLTAVNTTTGTVRTATTPVPFANSIQADYVGGGLVVTLNGTGSGKAPEMTNLSNGTSWPSGLSVGVATNNAYWVAPLRAFLDVAGPHLAELKVSADGKSIHNVGNAWTNISGVTSVTAVNGVVYDAADGLLAVQLATNLGAYVSVVKLTGGVLTPAGAYAYPTTTHLEISRYCYVTGYVWATVGGTTELFDPFTNASLPAPNVVTRQESSGADNNYEFTSPTTTSVYLSFNVSLLGLPSRAPNAFVWAQAVGAGGLPATPGTAWVLLILGLVCLAPMVYYAERRSR